MISELLTMDAGYELNLQIAKLQGWSIEEVEGTEGSRFEVCRPGEQPKPRDAWRMFNSWHLHDLYENLPDFSGDLNEAWALVQIIKTFQVSVDSANCVALIIPLGGLPIFGEAPIDKPALAICRAWIAWKLWQQEGGAK